MHMPHTTSITNFDMLIISIVSRLRWRLDVAIDQQSMPTNKINGVDDDMMIGGHS